MKSLKEKFATGWLAVLLVAILTCIVLFFVSGCVTVDKAKQVLEKKGESAKYCAEKYPVKTEYIKGDSIITIDTIFVGNDIIFDTVYSVAKDTLLITKTIPVTKTIIKTVKVTDTIVKENTAAVEAAKVALNKCDEKYSSLYLKHEALAVKLDKVKKTRSTYFWLLILVTGLLFRKPIYNLIKTFV